ncbi:MAG: hypothetical protein QNL27_04870 [Bacteroidia bacterium]
MFLIQSATIPVVQAMVILPSSFGSVQPANSKTLIKKTVIDL